MTWPIHPDDPPIASDLPVEREATLRIYEWRDYLAEGVIRDFERRHASAGIRVHVESFTSMSEAVARLQRPDEAFDVFFPTISSVGRMVQARMLRPLNHDYLPNLVNLWPQFLGPRPFYDRGQRYTIPYTVYSSGIGWRRDLVAPSEAPDAIADAYGILWQPALRGRVGAYADYREALSLALLRSGVADVNTADGDRLAAAADELIGAIRSNGLALTDDGAEEGLPRGSFAAHQAWSGDMLSAPAYGSGGRAAIARELAYWRPDKRPVVGADLTAVLAQGRNPVLAHAFLNHLLDFRVAMDNFRWNGYQPPLRGADAAAFADPSFPWHDVVPPTLLDTILTPDQLENGRYLLELGSSADARWRREWLRVTAAARAAGALAG